MNLFVYQSDEVVKMAVVEFRKVRCDCCGKEEIQEEGGKYPTYWLEISITEWIFTSGHTLLNKDEYSKKCAVKLLNSIKKIPKAKYRM